MSKGSFSSERRANTIYKMECLCLGKTRSKRNASIGSVLFSNTKPRLAFFESSVNYPYKSKHSLGLGEEGWGEPSTQ